MRYSRNPCSFRRDPLQGCVLFFCRSEEPPHPLVLTQDKCSTEASLPTSWSLQSHYIPVNLTLSSVPMHCLASASYLLSLYSSLQNLSTEIGPPLSCQTNLLIFKKIIFSFFFNKCTFILEKLENKHTKPSQRKTKIRFWTISFQLFRCEHLYNS